jgi:hypothetical protein
MAQVTLGTPAPQRFVTGNLVQRFWVVNGVSGSTLNTNMVGVVWADAQASPQGGGASVITGYTVSSTGVVTFTTSGTMVNEVFTVVGREG